jgi:U3 small nucleolar RNA-associated protein 4
MTVVLTPAAPPISTLIKTVNPLDTSTESTFEDAYHRKLSYVRKGSVKVARAARFVSCAREAGISIWRIRKKVDKQEHLDREDGLEEQDFLKVDAQPEGPAWEKVLEMDLKVHSNIIAHDISDDGKWLVVSDLYESKLFSLRLSVSLLRLPSS